MALIWSFYYAIMWSIKDSIRQEMAIKANEGGS